MKEENVNVKLNTPNTIALYLALERKKGPASGQKWDMWEYFIFIKISSFFAEPFLVNFPLKKFEFFYLTQRLELISFRSSLLLEKYTS